MPVEAVGTPHRMSIFICGRSRLRLQLDTQPARSFLYGCGKSLSSLPEKWFMQEENVRWKQFFHYWEVVRSYVMGREARKNVRTKCTLKTMEVSEG